MSYRQRREYVWVTGLAGVQVGVICNPLDFELDERFAQSEVLRLSVRVTDPKADLLVEDGELRWSGRRFYIDRIVTARDDNGAELVTVEAPALWGRLADDKRVGTLELAAVTVDTGLATILDGTGWVPEVDAAVDGVTLYNLAANDATVLDLVRKWARITRCEVVFDTLRRVVRFVITAGADRGLGFRYRRNLLSVERDSARPPVTRLWPFGKDDVTITSANAGVPYLDDFTFYTDQGITLDAARARFMREEVWRDSTFVTAEDLLRGAQARLERGAQPEVNYRTRVVDLAELTGLADDRFELGDTVRVADAPLGINIRTRVVRIVRRPLDPAAAEVELSYLPLAAPDPDVGSQRAGLEDWTLFADRNEVGATTIDDGTSTLNRIDLAVVEGAQWVVGYTLAGIATGTGTISVRLFDFATGENLVPSALIPVVDGERVDYSTTFGDVEVASREWSIRVRAQSSGPGVGVSIDPNGTALWVLARGAQQRTLTVPNSVRYEHVTSVQSFTVPDDIETITIEAVGAAGGDPQFTSTPGKGARVAATFAVTPGDTFDVYVGGTDGYPLGGNNPSSGFTLYRGGDGGGATYIVPTGGTVADALLVAAGGGGAAGYNSGLAGSGGDGGFLAGGDGSLNGSVGGGGKGATDSAGGAGQTGVVPGSDGSFGHGGDGGESSLTFQGGGGGGGGWYGGGGGASAFSGSGGGGGGGSGYVRADGEDVETDDGINNTDGYLVISWDNALPV